MTCFITNAATIPLAEIIWRYREKNKIEEAFREMKSQLALRQIHLTRPERVKAHVSICILTYLLLNTIEIMLKQAGCSTSAKQVLKQMESCQLNEVGFKDSSNHSITITKMTEQQEKWMKLLHCQFSN